MLSKKITYVNPFTEESVVEEHYFHLSKADVMEMNMEEHKATYRTKAGEELEGLAAKLAMISESEDAALILAELKDVIRRAYGKKVGDRFIKSRENWLDFSSTEAYSQLLFDLYTNADEAGEFMNGLLPKGLPKEFGNAGPDDEAGTSAPTPVEVTPEPASEAPVPVPVPEEPASGMSAERKAVLDLASSENPIKLEATDMIDGDAEYIRSGLSTGRFTT